MFQLGMECTEQGNVSVRKTLQIRVALDIVSKSNTNKQKN